MSLRPLVLLVLACCIAASGPATGAEPIDFVLEDLDGQRHRLSDYRGKWVILNYWATWCPPCLDEIPELAAFHESHHRDLAVVLGINYERISRPKLRAFIDEQMIDYPVFTAQPGRRTPLGALRGLPTTFIIDPAGVPVGRQSGSVDAQMLESFIRSRAPDPRS